MEELPADLEEEILPGEEESETERNLQSQQAGLIFGIIPLSYLILFILVLIVVVSFIIWAMTRKKRGE